MRQREAKGRLSSRAHAEKAFEHCQGEKASVVPRQGTRGQMKRRKQAGLDSKPHSASQDDDCAASLNVTVSKRHLIRLRIIRFHSRQNNLDNE